MAKTEPTEKTIKLLKSHEHAGRQYSEGDEITLPVDAADWLVAIGSAQYL